MKNKQKEEILKQEKVKNFFQEQKKHNSRIKDFEKTSINMLILEILTRLTDKDLNNERYIENMLTEHIHQYIQDLGVLFNIRHSLESSEKSPNRNYES